MGVPGVGGEEEQIHETRATLRKQAPWDRPSDIHGWDSTQGRFLGLVSSEFTSHQLL